MIPASRIIFRILNPNIELWPHLTIADVLHAFSLLKPYNADFRVPIEPSTRARSRLISFSFFEDTCQSVRPFGAIPTCLTPIFRPMDRDELQNQAVCGVMFQALDDLNLKHEELAEILGVDDRTTKRWQAAGRIATLKGKSVREPTQHFLAIFATLVEMFSAREDREAWLKSEHPVLKRTPLSLMIESFENLANVRRYIEFVSSRGA